MHIFFNELVLPASALMLLKTFYGCTTSEELSEAKEKERWEILLDNNTKGHLIQAFQDSLESIDLKRSTILKTSMNRLFSTNKCIDESSDDDT